jgi:hypothetical protein
VAGILNMCRHLSAFHGVQAVARDCFARRHPVIPRCVVSPIGKSSTGRSFLSSNDRASQARLDVALAQQLELPCSCCVDAPAGAQGLLDGRVICRN